MTKAQAENLKDKLEAILDVFDENEQYEVWCQNWLQEDHGEHGKVCNYHCPMAHGDGKCIIDEARATLKEVGGE